ncbi:14087_t:CDS:2, partial [Gigaspora rosea]
IQYLAEICSGKPMNNTVISMQLLSSRNVRYIKEVTKARLTRCKMMEVKRLEQLITTSQHMSSFQLTNFKSIDEERMN